MIQPNINDSLLRPTLMNIDELHYDPHNARTHSERNIEAIKKSLQEFGQQKPVIVLASGKIIAGNGTVMAAKQLGWGKLAVVEFNSEDEARATAYAIADNRTAELADWEPLNLIQAFDSLPSDYDKTVLGFTENEIGSMRAGLNREESDALLRRLNVTIGPPKTVVEHKQVWRLGEHRLICASPISEPMLWNQYIQLGCLFIPFPGAYITLTKRAKFSILVMVHPDPFVCGHLIDNHKDAYSESEVRMEE